MATIMQINVQRISVTSRKTFADVVAALERQLGRPDMSKFFGDIAASRSAAELERIIKAAVGPLDLMEFARFDQGAVLQRTLGKDAPQVMRFLVGNPLVMKEMVKVLPDAGSYAPVTILIDERADGVHLSYDRIASFLASYGNAEALEVAKTLDGKIEALLVTAAN